jgi:hypothetical protein
MHHNLPCQPSGKVLAVNDIAQAVAHLINDWGWLIVLGLVTGGGDALGRIFDGRRKNAALKAKLDAATEENSRLENLLTSATQTLGGSGADGAEIAGLVAQARTAVDDRAELMDLLSQVQATDNAVPQLPQELHDAIADVLGRYRSRLATRAIDSPLVALPAKASAKRKRA